MFICLTDGEGVTYGGLPFAARIVLYRTLVVFTELEIINIPNSLTTYKIIYEFVIKWVYG